MVLMMFKMEITWKKQPVYDTLQLEPFVNYLSHQWVQFKMIIEEIRDNVVNKLNQI